MQGGIKIRKLSQQGSHLPSIEDFKFQILSCTLKICKPSYTGLYKGGLKLRKLTQYTPNIEIQWEP